MTATRRTLQATACGLPVVAVLALLTPWQVALMTGWTVGAAVYLATVWRVLLPHDAGATESHARRVDESRTAAEVSLLLASAASLIAILMLLVKASEVSGTTKAAYTALAIVSILLSWATVHTVYTLRYSQEFFRDPRGGVDFNGDEPPTYRDFAYLAFTVGMTYQVSDTNLTTAKMRRLALQHALLSFLFGTAIIATTINVVAGLLG
jgi:uncharacterized membrane protein